MTTKMKTIKKLMLVLCTSIFGFAANAQTGITVEASQMFTNFKFTDSEGNQDKEYTSNLSGAYHVGYRYDLDNGVVVQANVGMRTAGASLLYDNSNYNWDLQYVDVRLGVGYLYDMNGIKPYLMVSPYYGQLLKANQLLNNENFDLKASGELQTNDFGVFLSPGVQFDVSDYISVYSQFDYMMGLQNLETNTNGQQSQNVAMAISVGAVFALK